MTSSYISFAVTILVGVCTCAPEPYLRVKGKVSWVTEVGRPTFNASGLQVTIKTACHATIAEHWCPLNDPRCGPNPIVVKNDPAECPPDVKPDKFSLRTPWGQTYPGESADGVLDVKIDWSAVGGDAVADLDFAALRTNWVVLSGNGTADENVRLELNDDELRALLVAIGKSTGHDYSEAPAGRHASLTVAVSGEPSTSAEAHIVVSVTNRGPDSAYRVVAHVKIGAGVRQQGGKLSFGRIDVGETRKTTKGVAMGEGEDPNPMVDVEVTSSNAASVSASSKIRLKPEPARPVPPQLSCTLPVKQAAPGQRLRVECEASNPNDAPIRGLTYQVSIGQATAVPATGLGRLDPHAQRKFENEVTVPVNAQGGASLQVKVTVSVPDAPPVQQDILVTIVEPQKLCSQGELTIQDYQRKRKRLDDERVAGNITKEAFNDDLAELWSCVRQ